MTELEMVIKENEKLKKLLVQSGKYYMPSLAAASLNT